MPDFVVDTFEQIGGAIEDSIDWNIGVLGDVASGITGFVDDTVGQIPIVGDYIVPATLALTGNPLAAAAYVGAKSAVDTGDPLTGALNGGLSWALSGLGDIGGEAIGELAGDAPFTAMSDGGLPMTTTANLQAGNYSGLTDLASSGVSQGGGMSSFNLGDILGVGKSIYSGMQAEDTNDEIKKQLLAATGNAQRVLAPFTNAGATAAGQLSSNLTSGFNPGDLASDPGYQFRMQQGNTALSRALASQGLGQSGAAVKAAMDYNQGLADTTYNDAYTRWLQKNSQLQGLTGVGTVASNSMANVFGNQGAVNALATRANSDASNQMVSSILNSDALKKALLQGSGLLGLA